MILDQKTKERLRSKSWRISHFYSIKDKQKNLIRFTPNKAQMEFEARHHSRNVILKSRQLGFSTYESIDILDDALFLRNYDAAVIAHEKDAALDIFDNKIALAWEHYPLRDLYSIDRDTAYKLKFGFGDKTYSSVSVKLSGRSGTYHRIHITEFAKLCAKYPLRAKEIMEGTIPSVPLDCRIDIESTAEGTDGYFYNMFWDAWDRGEPTHASEFKAHFFNWTYDLEEIAKVKEPIKQLPSEFIEIQKKHGLTDIQISYYFLKWMTLQKDWNALFQEYPTTPADAFRYSGNLMFSVEKLDKQVQYEKAGERIGNWVFYEKYMPGHRYALGADVAEGVGLSSSTAVIWDFTPVRPRVVAEYENNRIAPDLFAYELKTGGQNYGTCLLAVENNNKGHTTLTILRTIYPEEQIYRHSKKHEVFETPITDFGWNTNLVSKPKMLYNLNTAVNNELVEICSRVILGELRRYPQGDLNAIKATQDDTKHYDRVMALAIGFAMRDEDLDKNNDNQERFVYNSNQPRESFI